MPLPIANRLRFGNGVLTQCRVQALAHNPLQAQFLSSAKNDGRVDVAPRRRHLNSPRFANPGGQSIAGLNLGPTGHVFAVTRENVEHEQPHWYFPQQLCARPSALRLNRTTEPSATTARPR